MVLEKAESLGYISDDKNYVLVSMALNDKNKKTRDKREEKIDELKETIEQGIEALDNDTIVHRTVTVDLEERNKALENELSMGRYYLYLEAKEKGMDITIDEVKSSKISDLIEKIEDNTELAPTPTPVHQKHRSRLRHLRHPRQHRQIHRLRASHRKLCPNLAQGK